MPTTPLQVFIPGLDNSGLKVCLRPWGQLGAGREEGGGAFLQGYSSGPG